MSDTVGSENSFPREQYRFPHPGRLEDDWRKWGFGQVVVGYGLSLVASIVTLSLISELAGYENGMTYQCGESLWLVSLSNSS